MWDMLSFHTEFILHFIWTSVDKGSVVNFQRFLRFIIFNVVRINSVRLWILSGKIWKPKHSLNLLVYFCYVLYLQDSTVLSEVIETTIDKITSATDEHAILPKTPATTDRGEHFFLLEHPSPPFQSEWPLAIFFNFGKIIYQNY